MKIGVLGAGTWGMALARMLATLDYEVTVWSAVKAEIDELKTTGRQKNLPDMEIPASIVFTTDIADAVPGADIVLFAVASVYIRPTAKTAAALVTDGQIIVNVSKGIETNTMMTMTQVIEDEFNKAGKYDHPYVALSGPTHAEEVARDLPTLAVSACTSPEIAKKVQSVFMNPRMRVYTNPDVTGVELCGAVKNIIALASGISTGLGYGDNARAALITRGIVETMRLGVAMGCQERTFHGLAGIGDMIVTATSMHSRNNSCGVYIGEGMKPEDAVKKVGMVVEGINAIPAVRALSEKYDVEMPIVEAVNAIINEGKDPHEAVNYLMTREGREEWQDA
ncbi:MAG: NAD(P)-dependent glycerol-3-phosphate dehydrogenase [Lachnospiraceae bacterium]|nr:NAD(P)-dependent glycerol-3-phosphate dehydrogenase [Lachnospiraceae bacterium]